MRSLRAPLSGSGLLIGDLLLRFEETSLQSPEDLIRALRNDCIGKSVPITLLRGGELQTLQVIVGERPER